MFLVSILLLLLRSLTRRYACNCTCGAAIIRILSPQLINNQFSASSDWKREKLDNPRECKLAMNNLIREESYNLTQRVENLN